MNTQRKLLALLSATCLQSTGAFAESKCQFAPNLPCNFSVNLNLFAEDRSARARERDPFNSRTILVEDNRLDVLREYADITPSQQIIDFLASGSFSSAFKSQASPQTYGVLLLSGDARTGQLRGRTYGNDIPYRPFPINPLGDTSVTTSASVQFKGVIYHNVPANYLGSWKRVGLDVHVDIRDARGSLLTNSAGIGYFFQAADFRNKDSDNIFFNAEGDWRDRLSVEYYIRPTGDTPARQRIEFLVEMQVESGDGLDGSFYVDSFNTATLLVPQTPDAPWESADGVFLATPVPEPPTVLLWIAGVSLLLKRKGGGWSILRIPLVQGDA